MVVVQEFEKLGLRYNTVDLGMVDLPDDLTIEQKKLLKEYLVGT